jgi:DNA-binding transcriptional LysR family regulator
MADLSDFETFIAAASTGSFAETARRLSISPAMVGRRIQALEERYGAKLIERTTRSHRLTALGGQFLEKATQIIESVGELDELARPADSQLSGRIRLTAPTTLGIKHLARIISLMSARHPDVIIEMSLSDRSVDLITGGFDLAVRIGELQSTSLIARRVGTYRFVCCAAPAYLDRHGTPRTPHELARARCVLNLNLVPRSRWPFQDEQAKPFSVEVSGSVEIDNGEAQRSAALAGAGIIFSPRDLVEDDLKQGALVEVLQKWNTFTLPIHAVHPSRRFVPRRVSALIEAVAEGLRGL